MGSCWHVTQVFLVGCSRSAGGTAALSLADGSDASTLRKRSGEGLVGGGRRYLSRAIYSGGQTLRNSCFFLKKTTNLVIIARCLTFPQKFFVATCNCVCVAKSPHLVVFQITGCLITKCLCTGFVSPSVRFGIFKGLLHV